MFPFIVVVRSMTEGKYITVYTEAHSEPHAQIKVRAAIESNQLPYLERPSYSSLQLTDDTHILP